MKRTCLVSAILSSLLIGQGNAQEKTPPKTDEIRERLQLPKSLTDEELKFLGSSSHRMHAAGGPNGPKSHLGKVARYAASERSRVSNRYRYARFMDQAWTVMLYRQGIIPHEDAEKVLVALEKTKQGGEGALKRILKDEDLASIPQIGRTLQEPMARMQLRDKQLDTIEAIHDFLDIVLSSAERHSETIMPGMTHMAHSQPITYGAYLVALHDGVYRGLEHLELAYKHTNENSGGCGATSGTGWPIDRHLITELLGFDKLVEPTYDGEAGQDYAMNTLFALSNIMLTISRTAMDHGIWGMEGYLTHRLPAAHLGVSSLMPQKAHSGSAYERVRMSTNEVIGATTTGMLGLHGEPFGDVLTSYQAAYRAPNSGAIGALCETEKTMIVYGDMLATVNVDKEKLLELARNGWSCTPDLQIKLVRDKGYGRRQAHRVCAVMVYIARDHRKITPPEITGAMLDEAAVVAGEPQPGLTTEELQEVFDPTKFLERHNNVGDPNPKETLRLIDIRRKQLAESRSRQEERRGRVEAGYDKLREAIKEIIGKEAQGDYVSPEGPEFSGT